MVVSEIIDSSLSIQVTEIKDILDMQMNMPYHRFATSLILYKIHINFSTSHKVTTFKDYNLKLYMLVRLNIYIVFTETERVYELKSSDRD